MPCSWKGVGFRSVEMGGCGSFSSVFIASGEAELPVGGNCCGGREPGMPLVEGEPVMSNGRHMLLWENSKTSL